MKIEGHGVWVGSAIAALATVWAAPAAAAPTRTALVLKAEAACSESLEILRDEIRVRLPADVELMPAGDESAGYWTLTWSPGPKGACALELKDIEPIVSLPLAAGAEPDQVRETAVRIAWFVSTTQPQAPEAPPVPIGPAVNMAYAGVELGVEDATLQALRASASLTDPSRLVVKPEPPPAAGDPSAMISEMSATLDAWRSSSPGLFSQRDSLISGDPWVWSVNGVEIPLELQASLFIDSMNVEGEGAFFGGVGVGMRMARRIGLGFSYRRLLNEVRSPNVPQPESNNPMEPSNEEEFPTFEEPAELADFHVFSMQLDYTLWDAEPWRVGLGVELGGGALEEESGLPRERRWRPVVMAQIGAQGSYAILPWLHLGLNMGYRGTLSLGSQQYTPEDLSGFSGMMSIRLDLL